MKHKIFKAMTKEISTKNTKNQIIDAYNELLEQIKSEKSDDTKQVSETKEKKEIVKKASENSSENIVKNISVLKILVSSSLEKIEKELESEYKKLSGIQIAIAIESKNLEELYGIKSNADSLSALIMAQKVKQKEFDEEIDEKRKDWEKEKVEKEIQINEQNDLVKKNRKREEEEYNYSLKLNRKKEQDAYEEKASALEKEIEEKKINFEKEISEREQNISIKEAEFAEMKKQIEKYPSNLDKAVKDAEKAVKDNLETQFKYEKELSTKDYETDIKLKNQIITSLESKIKEHEILIKQLTTKADAAGIQVKDIAIKAIEGSAGPRFVSMDKDNRQEDK